VLDAVGFPFLVEMGEANAHADDVPAKVVVNNFPCSLNVWIGVCGPDLVPSRHFSVLQ
jgi:hypothetical protein